MKAQAIVYTSNTGHTERYAHLLGAKSGLPVYTVENAKKSLKEGTPIIYLGWLMVNRVKGYKKVAKRYTVCAVCGVGLCDTGALLSEVRQACKISENIQVFTLQGGMDKEKLRGVHKYMIDMLTKMMSEKQQRTPEENRMLELLVNGGDFVREENLEQILSFLL